MVFPGAWDWVQGFNISISGCGGLTLAGRWVPTKATLSLSSSAGWGEVMYQRAGGSR